MKNCRGSILLCLASLLVTTARAEEPKAPGTVKELWADYDPRQEPLDAKIVREWEQDNIVYRYVTYHIGTFKNEPAQMAGFYGFPRNSTGARK